MISRLEFMCVKKIIPQLYIYIIRNLQLRQREGTPISNTVGPLFMASDQLPTFNDTQTNKDKHTHINLNKNGVTALERSMQSIGGLNRFVGS